MTTKKRNHSKMGRPKLPKSEKMSEHIKIRLTPGNRKKLGDVMASKGITTISEYFRLCIEQDPKLL
jgi:hypothetical protein